ncbi:MAG: BrnT family toxin [Mailhella sp.]|nr:BrnT family toxin [Mailhella sp.]
MNIKKHGISFQLAVEVFNDPDALFFEDPDHSSGEYRMTVFGSVGESFRVVRVSFTERRYIRIISARRAEKKEVRMLYA